MILYKYLRADYGMQAIEHQKLKVSHPYDLNDIYDCRPKIIYDDSFDSAKNEGFEQEFAKNVGLDVGIGCYCEHGDNLLLWSHYGDSHKGIALGFDLPVGVFENPDDSTDRRMIIKVQYPESNNRKVIHWQDGSLRLKKRIACRRFLRSVMLLRDGTGNMNRSTESLFLGQMLSVRHALFFKILARVITGGNSRSTLFAESAFCSTLE